MPFNIHADISGARMHGIFCASIVASLRTCCALYLLVLWLVVGQCFHHLSHLASFLHPIWFHLRAALLSFSLGLFIIGSQIVDNNFASANICAIVMGGSALLGRFSNF